MDDIQDETFWAIANTVIDRLIAAATITFSNWKGVATKRG